MSEVGYAGEIAELNQAAAKAAQPPELQSGENIEDWITSVAAWNDHITALVDDIELAAALTSRDPSARFAHQRDKARESIKEIISGLGSPRTAEHMTKLSETAARLHGQVKQLAQLHMEL